MRTVIILLALFTYSLEGEIHNEGEFEIRKELVDTFLSKYVKEARLDSPGVIIANMNEYANILFPYIKKIAISNGLDPVKLTNISQNFLGSSVTLTEGKLNGISTLNRYDDVLVKYKHTLKKLEIEFPILFSDLNFTYHYHLILLLMGPKGNMVGKIHNFEAHLVLSIDFNTYRAQIEELKITNSGFIQLFFEGQGILDVVINILSQFVTVILHPILIAIIEGIIKNVANTIVTDVNDFIDIILHHNSTNITGTFPKIFIKNNNI
ncbi:hypothetical protein JTB14_028573 [Gonioctena quinquepunctata]|nr:hypothetical protein JTB14_028573 [Gonioctena quinquepunctata]